MGKFLLLAFRNVFRNRRRTVMTLLMVGGGVAGLLLVGGFFAFMFRGLRESTIRTGLGHIQIFKAEHFTRLGFSTFGAIALSPMPPLRARRGSAHRVLRNVVEWREVFCIHGQRGRSRHGAKNGVRSPHREWK